MSYMGKMHLSTMSDSHRMASNPSVKLHSTMHFGCRQAVDFLVSTGFDCFDEMEAPRIRNADLKVTTNFYGLQIARRIIGLLTRLSR